MAIISWKEAALSLVLSLILYEKKTRRTDAEQSKATPGLEQTELGLNPQDEPAQLLDPKTGQLARQGWQINAEDYLEVNQDSAAHSSWWFRSLDFFQITTPEHQINTVFNLKIGNAGCMSNVAIFERDNIDSLTKQEAMVNWNCPQVSDPSSSFSLRKDGVSLDNENLKMSVAPIAGDSERWELYVKATDIDFEMRGVFNNKQHDSFMWLQPLKNDKTCYFETVKKIALAFETLDYTFKSKTYSFNNKDAFITAADSFRAHFDYNGSYHWANFATKDDQGNVFGVSMSQGIGVKYDGKDRATEDFITVNGEAFKLDTTDFSKASFEDPMSQKHIETVDYRKSFPDRFCRLTFDPKYRLDDGYNIVLLQFSQLATYGHFNGVCHVDGRDLEVKNVWGFFEEVRHKW